MESKLLWEQYSVRLKSYAFSKVKDRDLVNDMMQDIYIKFHLNYERLKVPGKIQAWLFSVTRNTINDHFRKQYHLSGQVDTINEELKDSMNFSLEKCLVPHISKLPAMYKEAFTMVELENLSQLELAKKLNISYSGAKSRVQRAKQLLKKYFSECCDVTYDKYGNVLSHSMGRECRTC